MPTDDTRSGPRVITVIPGYDALCEEDRTKLDAMMREWKRKRDAGIPYDSWADAQVLIRESLSRAEGG